jgi:hypothetical protein
LELHRFNSTRREKLSKHVESILTALKNRG